MKQYFDIIQDGGDRLMKTVHGVLDISQLETGNINLNPEIVDLKIVLSNIITSLESRADEKLLGLKFETRIRKSTLKIDSYCATQALENLIDNAIKYTEKGGVTIKLQRKGKKLVVTVTDTGIGMSKKFMRRMFDPFTQESEGYSKKYQGVGIGLSLTKRYLEKINAELQVESEKGKGSTFTVIFNNDIL
jgi:signal transduction histidine kinase